MKRIIVCEDLNFIWDEFELSELAKMWDRNLSVNHMAEYLDRDSDEILLAIIHLARDDKITARRNGLLG